MSNNRTASNNSFYQDESDHDRSARENRFDHARRIAAKPRCCKCRQPLIAGEPIKKGTGTPVGKMCSECDPKRDDELLCIICARQYAKQMDYLDDCDWLDRIEQRLANDPVEPETREEE